MGGSKVKERVTYNKEKKTYMIEKTKKSEASGEIEVKMEDILLDGGFTMVPNLLIDNYKKIGMADRHLIMTICLLKYAHVKRRPFPSQKTLARIIQQSARTARRVIHELKMKGYLTIYKRYYKEEGKPPHRTSNVYSLKGLINKLHDLEE